MLEDAYLNLEKYVLENGHKKNPIEPTQVL